MKNTGDQNSEARGISVRGSVSYTDDTRWLLTESQNYVNTNSKHLGRAKITIIALSISLGIVFIALFVSFILNIVQWILYEGKFHEKLIFGLMCNETDMKFEEMNPPYNVELIKSHGFQLEMRKEIRKIFFKNFKQQKNDGLIYIVGSTTSQSVDGFDRQDSNFLYLSGILWPDYEIFFDIETEKSILLVPNLGLTDRIVTYPFIPTTQQLKDQFDIDQVVYSSNVTSILQQRYHNKIVYVLDYQLKNHQLNMTLLDTVLDAQVDSTLLKNILYDSRNIKTEKEIAMIKYANLVSSEAHIQLMKSTRPYIWEYHLEGIFRFMTTRCGLTKQAYEPICGSGTNSAVLHYVFNDKQIQGLPTNKSEMVIPQDIILVDAGAEFARYASDITRTYPSTGTFSPEQANIYNVVLESQKVAISIIKEGVHYNDVIRVCETTMLAGLQKLGFIRSDVSIETAIEKRIGRLFQPHGLGHYVGLDVHDTTVYPQMLKQGMVVTVEPGIYFIPMVFETANEDQKKMLNMDLITLYYNFGGIRIEDDILVTKDGFENLTLVPKELEEVESLMA